MIHTGDCVEVMAAMPENSVDAIVCDPPYGLEFMGKEWDRLTAVPERDDRWSKNWGGYGWHGGGRTDPTRMQEWHQRWATEAFRVAKPGAYLLAFGGTRTYHRLAVAIEDAGWIIRDCLVWAYLSGFPKSRASLKPSWEPIVLARKPGPLRMLDIEGCRIPGEPWPAHDASGLASVKFFTDGDAPVIHKEPAEGGRWPANIVMSEPVFDEATPEVVGSGPGMSRVFRVPSPTLSGTISTCVRCGAPTAETSSSSGIRATNGSSAPVPASAPVSESKPQDAPAAAGLFDSDETATAPSPARTPSDGMLASTASADESPIASDTYATDLSTSPVEPPATSSPSDPHASPAAQPPISTDTTTITHDPLTCERCVVDAIWRSTQQPPKLTERELPDDAPPDYARFYLVAKAARAEREPVFGELTEKGWTDGRSTHIDNPHLRMSKQRKNHHPTVKPVDLMRHLVRLVTPTGGTVLDPFLGSGTTAIAAEMEGFAWIGIEREAEYCQIAEARLMGVQKGLGLDVPAPTPRNPHTHPDLSKHQPKRRTMPQSSLYGGGLIGNDLPTDDAA